MQQPTGYCVACKAMREMKDVKQIERAGGPAIEGLCSACNAKMFILGAELPGSKNDAPAASP